ncbi:hypothetical protein P3T73_12410 [Kiritimatiellota bacterium B12222]|nr:hypothetical protein P3T73_12410 [Kiritimatiellota bacterium B12222]
MKKFIHTILLLALCLMVYGCGRSVTLRANSGEVTSSLERLDEARRRKENILLVSLATGLMVENAMRNQSSSEKAQKNSEKVFAGALGAGVLISSVMPDYSMGSYQLQEFSVKRSSWNAVFTRDDFRAKVKLKEGNDQMTTVKVYANESETTNLEDFVLVLKKWAESL